MLGISICGIYIHKMYTTVCTKAPKFEIDNLGICTLFLATQVTDREGPIAMKRAIFLLQSVTEESSHARILVNISALANNSHINRVEVQLMSHSIVRMHRWT